MQDLTSEKCEACRFDAPRVEGEERVALAEKVPAWDVVEIDGIERLKRVFQFKSYAEGLTFINRVAQLAEEEDHHPLMVLEWGRVTVEWWTHKIGGLHRNDFISAAKTDQIFGP